MDEAFAAECEINARNGDAERLHLKGRNYSEIKAEYFIRGFHNTEKHCKIGKDILKKRILKIYRNTSDI
jgi:hypothetical protein